MSAFGEALGRELARRSLSQNEAAKLTGISQSMLSSFVTGSRTPQYITMVKLIRVFPRLAWAMIEEFLP